MLPGSNWNPIRCPRTGKARGRLCPLTATLLLQAPARSEPDAVEPAGRAAAAGSPEPDADTVIDMLLAKGRAADRREWLMSQGNRAEVEV